MSDLDDGCLGNEIAIVGMSARFPKAGNVGEYWQNLCDGVEAVTFFSDEELLSSGVSPAEFDQPNYVKARAILDDIDMFDAAFFGFTPRQAQVMDPQHRFFLECSWEALENAGYDPLTYEGAIGVYAGAGLSYYLMHNLYPNSALRALLGVETATLNARDFLTTHVSYALNLKGPSVNVQTACSTSLVATHLACQSLLNGECDMALAGGVTIVIPQRVGYFCVKDGSLSPDGHCRAFDADAAGILGGSGVGIVVLKCLDEAIVDGDHIYAVIKGSAINNDGASKVGFAAPSVDGQANAIAEALALAEVDPATVTYVEAHGTGTPMGDPIEIAALTRVFRSYTEAKGYCAIGSVKTNIGHADSAAGVAGLIKVALAFKNRLLPPSLHFKRPNPNIDFENGPFYVNAELAEWETGDLPRRAGVSAFGIGGTNAHVVLEEVPEVEPSGPSRSWQLLVLSARTKPALDEMTSDLVQYIGEHPELGIADLAYTLQVGRHAHNHRRTLVCHNLEDAVAALDALDPERVLTRFYEPGECPVVFMFPGGGAQYPAMGAGIYKEEAVFREQVDVCSELVRPYLGCELRDVLYPDDDRTEETVEQFTRAGVVTAAIFATEYALAKLWMTWGVQPAAMIGHSLGEYVAACLAEVMSLEDALSLVVRRGSLLETLPPGAMLSVPLAEQDLRSLLSPALSIAAVNGPSLCVVSGSVEAVAELEKLLASEGHQCRMIHVTAAGHSEMVTPILPEFAASVDALTLSPPRIPYVSCVTGTWITADEVTEPDYWTRHLRQAVRFAEGIRELLKRRRCILLEVGPGRTLSTLARRQIDADSACLAVESLRHPKDQVSDTAFLLGALGKLWISGVSIDWSSYRAHERRHRLPLPTYPFQRQRYWAEPSDRPDQIGADQIPAAVCAAASDIDSGFLPPRQQRPNLLTEFVAPRTELEQAVAVMWQDLVGIEQVGIHDSFFELGGHSLLAVQIVSRLQQLFSVELSLRAVFERPTVAALAEMIEEELLERLDGMTDEQAEQLL